MAVTLGKDCTVSVDGTITSARNVSFSSSVKTIDINAFDSRYAEVYPVAYENTVQIEFNDSADVGAVAGWIESGTTVTVSGGVNGWSFPAVITAFSESDPLDGAVAFTVEAKRTRPGLR